MVIVGMANHHGGQQVLFFCESNKSSFKLSKDIQNFIELKKIKGINLRIVEEEIKGKLKQQGLKNDQKKYFTHD